MKIRHTTSSGQDKIQLQMTPMIDIVFQLLVFFIMTFKIVSQEGDFNITMPLAAPKPGIPEDMELLPLRIRLSADENGNLAGISMNDRSFGSFEQLNSYVIGYIGDDTGPDSARETAEVELDCDYDLHYKHVIAAITAVSGYVDETTGQVVKLVEKIKFSPVEERSQ